MSNNQQSIKQELRNDLQTIIQIFTKMIEYFNKQLK